MRLRLSLPALGLAVPILLAACAVGPSYHRPGLALPARFSTASDPGAAAAPGWWRGFGSPELDRLVATAVAGNLDVEQAVARVVQADQAVRVAASPLLPQVNGTAGYTWQRTGTEGGRPLPGQGYYTETRSTSLQLQASYEIDFWGKNADAARAAAASALASRFDVQTTLLTTVADVADTYFQALGYHDRLRIAEENLRTASQVLEAFRARLEAGTATALDVSQQEALVAGYRAQVPALRSLYEQEVIALGILLGVPPERVSITPVALPSLHLPPVAPGLPASLLRRRPDVASAEAQLIAQNETVRQDIANFFPSLTFNASGGLASLAISTLTGPGTVAASLAGQLAQTIFDNGLKSGTLGEARGRYRELTGAYVKSVLQALTDVETALTQVRELAEQERLQAQAVATAQRSADIARAQLQAGTVDIVTVLNTETTLFNDQDTLSQVQVQRFTALVALYRALGGGWSA